MNTGPRCIAHCAIDDQVVNVGTTMKWRPGGIVQILLILFFKGIGKALLCLLRKKMVVYCFVEGCKSTRYKKKYETTHINEIFFGFPTDPDLREKWIEALSTLNKQESAQKMTKSSKICKLHFSDDCFEKFGFSNVRLKKKSIPSKFPRMQNNSLNQSTARDLLLKETIEPSIIINNNQEIKFDSTSDSNQLDKEIQSINLLTPITSMNCSETDPQHGSLERMDICKTPTQQKIRYPGEDIIKDMTPRTLIKYTKLLNRACVKKDHTIKRLQNEQICQKRKIESLQKLLSELKQKCLLSPNSSQIVQDNAAPG